MTDEYARISPIHLPIARESEQGIIRNSNHEGNGLSSGDLNLSKILKPSYSREAGAT